MKNLEKGGMNKSRFSLPVYLSVFSWQLPRCFLKYFAEVFRVRVTDFLGYLIQLHLRSA